MTSADCHKGAPYQRRGRVLGSIQFTNKGVKVVSVVREEGGGEEGGWEKGEVSAVSWPHCGGQVREKGGADDAGEAKEAGGGGGGGHAAIAAAMDVEWGGEVETAGGEGELAGQGHRGKEPAPAAARGVWQEWSTNEDQTLMRELRRLRAEQVGLSDIFLLIAIRYYHTTHQHAA